MLIKFFSNKKKLNSLLKDLDNSLAIKGENHPDTAEIHIKIGLFYSLKTSFRVNKEELSIALEHYHKGLRVYKKMFGDDDLRTAELHCDIAELYALLYDFPEALDHYHKGIFVYEREFGDKIEESNVFYVYNEIAKLYEYQGNLSESLRFFHKVLPFYIKKYGEENSVVSDINISIKRINEIQKDNRKTVLYS